MTQTGIINKIHGLEKHGITNAGTEHWNYNATQLTEHALKRGEVALGKGGSIIAKTGQYTGRSPQDKFFVVEPTSEKSIDWGSVNQPISEQKFDDLYSRVTAHLQGRDVFVQDCWAGADEKYRIGVRVINEQAWHNMFARNMFRVADQGELPNFVPDFTVIQAPSFKAEQGEDELNSEAFCLIHLGKKIILIGGTEYAGEIKKGIFTVLNYLLPEQGVFPMHCSANMGADGDTAIFFGLSGTGKTTLSADASRQLIGDDEHGWSNTGVFNFEGGCYAKAIGLTPEQEPEIYATTTQFGTILENVVYDENTRMVDFDDVSITQNTRVSYPIKSIPNHQAEGQGNHPKNIIMLTCDAFGVLPPVSRLTAVQAMEHFMAGYTAKVAGTERGVTEPTAVFSACFGAPFMPRHPREYAEMLGTMMDTHNATCWLVNTGWSGGGYGVGKRMALSHTRTLVNGILDGALQTADYATDSVFGLAYPTHCGDVPADILNPRDAWADKQSYDDTANKLLGLFTENHAKYQ